MFEQLLQNPDQITFTVLFVVLFVYTMRTNEKREENYRETISDMRKALLNTEEVKKKINEIHQKVS